jgi:hypothetical protein
LGKLPWRHTNRKRDHSHHPNANDRNGAAHDHRVAQVGHRKGFLEYAGSVVNADTIARSGGLCQCLGIRLWADLPAAAWYFIFMLSIVFTLGGEKN